MIADMKEAGCELSAALLPGGKVIKIKSVICRPHEVPGEYNEFWPVPKGRVGKHSLPTDGWEEWTENEV